MLIGLRKWHLTLTDNEISSESPALCPDTLSGVSASLPSVGAPLKRSCVSHNERYRNAQMDGVTGIKAC